MHIKAAGLIVSGLLLVTGCSTGSSSPKAAPTASGSGPAAAPSQDGSTAPGGAGATAAAFARWRIKPMAPAPAAPKEKPVRTGAGLPPVISDIPTKDKVVFVTFDDGAEKDPKFVTMMGELKVPFTMFLTDDIIRSDYGYFKPLQKLGNAIQNHTLTHPNLRTESESAQRHEICTQQTKLKAEYGTTPRLFRPPYGNLNEATKTAAKSCGVQAIILWRESMQIKGMQYQRGDKKLHPGDIILAHFRGPSELKGTSMTEMTANLLREISEQGFTVARLEDYV
jgi:peptidoglycan/xylan/chitin deacetylase (PgdA/CDA1 family)